MIDDLVSIITPSYNTARFIGETIQSVINQTYTNWEMIIVDDCSTDNTDEVVKPYLVDARIRYLKNPKNSGAAVSRNYALREAKGRWIAFLDSDDLWYPEKLEKQIAFMKKNNYAFTCTARESMREDGTLMKRYVGSPKHVGKIGMFAYCWPGCLGTMYDAKVVGLIQVADLKKNNDYAMWLKVIKKTDFYFLDEILAIYRVRERSISHDKLSKLIKAHYDLFRIGEGMNPVSSTILAFTNMLVGPIKKKLYLSYKKYDSKKAGGSIT